jgi:hypothetical protein
LFDHLLDPKYLLSDYLLGEFHQAFLQQKIGKIVPSILNRENGLALIANFAQYKIISMIKRQPSGELASWLTG